MSYYNNQMFPFQTTLGNSINPYAQTRQNVYQPQNNGINWVQGIEGAKAWQLEPNSNVMLLDSENDGKFYIKTSDNVGMCTLRTFEFVEVTNAPTNSSVDLSRYVTRDELTDIILAFKEDMYNGKQSLSTNGGGTNQKTSKQPSKHS